MRFNVISRKYRKPPVSEAVCEFRFEPSSTWDLTIPGLIYDRIKQDFPKRKLAKAVEFSVVAGPEGIAQQSMTTDRMQFLREDEKALIQVDRDLLAINHLKPYPTWETFLPLIRQGFEAYIQVTNPRAIHRIGLRYINRIEIPGKRAELQDYLELRPSIGPDLPQDFGPFLVKVGIPYSEGQDILSLQSASAIPHVLETIPVVLDLDYYLAVPGRVPLEDAFSWIETAHTRVEEAFEACITDRLRVMFEEVRN
jgi:uncharacterized protein (TIGR04255 family)